MQIVKNTPKTQSIWYRFKKILNNVIPFRHCGVCFLPSLQPVCNPCLNELMQLPPYGVCQQCKKAISSHKTLCSSCMENETHFDNLYCPYLYHKPLSSMLHLLKYKQIRYYAKALGYLLNIELQKLDADLIIPTPIHKQRRIERGFNQVELLLKAYKKGKIPVIKNALTRVIDTNHQTLISRESRIHNLKNAFWLNIDVTNKHIILVDDVVTTNATANAISQYLKDQGASQVDVVCLLRTL